MTRTSLVLPYCKKLYARRICLYFEYCISLYLRILSHSDILRFLIIFDLAETLPISLIVPSWICLVISLRFSLTVFIVLLLVLFIVSRRCFLCLVVNFVSTNLRSKLKKKPYMSQALLSYLSYLFIYILLLLIFSPLL